MILWLQFANGSRATGLHQSIHYLEESVITLSVIRIIKFCAILTFLFVLMIYLNNQAE